MQKLFWEDSGYIVPFAPVVDGHSERLPGVTESCAGFPF